LICFILVVAAGAYYWFWGAEQPTTPRRLFELSREKFAEREWDGLYDYTAEKWRDEYIPLMRRHLEYLLRYAETEAVDAQTAVTFSNRQVFRVWLEVYSQTPEGEELLENIEDIEIEKLDEKDDETIIYFYSPVEIPADFDALVARKINGYWKIIDLKET